MNKKSVRIEGYDQIANEALNEIIGQLASKHVYKVKIERSCKGDIAGYVIPGADAHTIHLCSENIKKSFGKIHPTNPEENQKLKELIKRNIQKIVMEHEATHVKQLEKINPEDIETKRKQLEQEAERSEQKGRKEMEKEFGIVFKKMSSMIDEVSDSLEGKGLIKEAEVLDIISNTLEKEESNNSIDTAVKLEILDKVASYAEGKGLIKEAEKLDIISNTLEVVVNKSNQDSLGNPLNQYKMPIKLWANLGPAEQDMLKKWFEGPDGIRFMKKWNSSERRWDGISITEDKFFKRFPEIYKYLNKLMPEQQPIGWKSVPKTAGMGKKLTPVQVAKFKEFLNRLDSNELNLLKLSNKKWWDNYTKLMETEDGAGLQEKSFAYMEEAFPANIMSKYQDLEDFLVGEIPDVHPTTVIKILDEIKK